MTKMSDTYGNDRQGWHLTTDFCYLHMSNVELEPLYRKLYRIKRTMQF
jgi:hypothetical protein